MSRTCIHLFHPVPFIDGAVYRGTITQKFIAAGIRISVIVPSSYQGAL
jgi:hypothetical protein